MSIDTGDMQENVSHVVFEKDRYGHDQRIFLQQEVGPEGKAMLRPLEEELEKVLQGDYVSDPNQHMTTVHLGFVSSLISEIRTAGGSVSSTELEKRLGSLVIDHIDDLPAVSEVRGHHLGTLGRSLNGKKRVVLFLDPTSFPQGFQERRDVFIAGVQNVIRACGVVDLNGFLERSRNLSHLTVFNPHISVGRTAAGNQIPALPVADIQVPLLPSHFAHVKVSR